MRMNKVVSKLFKKQVKKIEKDVKNSGYYNEVKQIYERSSDKDKELFDELAKIYGVDKYIVAYLVTKGKIYMSKDEKFKKAADNIKEVVKENIKEVVDNNGMEKKV